MKGLIVDEPWISLILKGQKTWEMRSRHTQRRGAVALIRKGSCQVVGVTHVVDTRGPLSAQELDASAALHQIPMEELRSGRTSTWNIAWELKGTVELPIPVRYAHPNGAVIWVDLDVATSAQVLMQLDDTVQADHGGQPALSTDVESPGPPASNELLERDDAFGDPLVPVSNDGSWFGPYLLKAGEFTIGAKGEETRADNFVDALDQLSRMTVPRWRRPNSKGNWGIVSGVKWKRLSECSRDSVELR